MHQFYGKYCIHQVAEKVSKPCKKLQAFQKQGKKNAKSNSLQLQFETLKT